MTIRTQVVTVVALVALATACTSADARLEAGATWRSDSTTRWITFDTLSNFRMAPTGGFAIVGDDVWVADLRASRIVELRRNGAHWRHVRDLVSPLLSSPRSLAALDGGRTLAVLDTRERMLITDVATGQFTRVDGKLPCRVAMPELVSDEKGNHLVVTGDCRTPGADTVVGVAAVSVDSGRHFSIVARAPRYGADGSWGSVLSARHFVSPGDTLLSFGTGNEDCVQQIRLRTRQRIADDCALPPVRYAAPAPAAWNTSATQSRLRMTSPVAARWPVPLIRYMDRIDVNGRPVYVRLVGTSTVELQLGGTDAGSPLLAAPLDGFRGCTPAGCLWMQMAGQSMAIRVLTPSYLDSLARDAGSARLTAHALH